MTLLSTQSFRFNKDETENRLRFPDIAESALSFSIAVGTKTYTVIVAWNTWLNSPTVSIYTANTSPVALNLPLSARITDVSPNYLSDQIFRGYYLFWEPGSSWFGFYRE